ncbi:hypothetical protein Plhal304r1_c010g0039141 [Plasmopara halstedii]
MSVDHHLLLLSLNLLNRSEDRHRLISSSCSLNFKSGHQIIFLCIRRDERYSTSSKLLPTEQSEGISSSEPKLGVRFILLTVL